MCRSVVVVFLLFVCNLCAASDVSGFWQHPRDPVWIDVDEVLGTGLAVRNDNDPSSVGFAVLREVVGGAEQGQWTGEVYVPQLGDYKPVVMTLPNVKTLKMNVKIGFITRTLEWTKVSLVPQP